jgi:hypothetical protein
MASLPRLDRPPLDQQVDDRGLAPPPEPLMPPDRTRRLRRQEGTARSVHQWPRSLRTRSRCSTALLTDASQQPRVKISRLLRD